MPESEHGRFVEVGATEVAGTEVRVGEVGATEVAGTEVRVGEVGATEVAGTEVRVGEVGATEVAGTEVRVGEVGATEVAGTEVRVGEVGAAVSQENVEGESMQEVGCGSMPASPRAQKGDWRKTGQKKAWRPRKRGRRSEEAVKKSEMMAQGKKDKLYQVHHELRKEPEGRKKAKTAARDMKYRDKQRCQKVVRNAKRPAAEGEEKPEPKKSSVSHVVGKVEQLDPAVYARMVKLMGKPRLEEFVRNAGNTALGLERGKRYKGPGTEAEMMELLRGLRMRRGESIVRKKERLSKELEEMFSEKEKMKGLLEELQVVDLYGNPINVELKAKADEVLARYAEKEQELAEAKKDWEDVAKAKKAYWRLWSRRNRAQEETRRQKNKEQLVAKASEWRRKWNAEVILKAKARATKRPDLLRRVQMLRELRTQAAERRWYMKKLNVVSGTGKRKQEGDKFQRVVQQTRFEAVLVKMMFQRSVKTVRTHVRVKENEKVQEERTALAQKVKRAVRCGIGHKTQLLKDFVRGYGNLWDEVEKIRVKSSLEAVAGKGKQTFEELLRPESAQVHRKGQKPYGWVKPVSDDEMVTETESEEEPEVTEEAEKSAAGKTGQGSKPDGKGKEGKPKCYKKSLAEMRERSRKRQKAKVAKAEETEEASAQEAAKCQKKLRKKQTGWGGKDNCVCGPECQLPKDWADRVMAKLLKLRPYRGDVTECLKDMMDLEQCPGCWKELAMPCVLGDKCEDVVKLCLAVRPHSLKVAELLDEMMYPVKVIMRSVLTLEKALENGTVEELVTFLKGSVKKRESGGEEAAGMPAMAGPEMNSVALEEKYGELLAAFRKLEQDHPVHPCYWCERRMSKKQMRFVSLASLEDTSEHRMQEKTVESIEARVEERLKSEGKGQKPEEVFPMGICEQCYGLLQRRTIAGPMAENGMYADEIPEELEVLNPYEMMMVSLAKPFYTCVRLKTAKGGGRPSELLKATRGNVAHLRIPLEETLDHVMKTVEPVVNNPAEFLTIYADVKTRAKTVWRNLVNMDKVVAALEFLKKSNRLYRKVKVDKEGLKKLKVSEFVKLAEMDKPETVDGNLEGSASEEEDEPEKAAEAEGEGKAGVEGKAPEKGEPFLTQDLGHKLDAEFSMQPLNADKVAVGEDANAYAKTGKYRQKDIKGEPLRAQKEADLDLMCFPRLHPMGRYGLCEKRAKAVRPAEYYKYRLQNKDPRWRRDITWLHVAHFYKLERQVQSGVYASMHMGAASANLNRDQVLKKLRGQDDSEQLAVDMSSAMACMKGTPEYWNKKAGILRTMDEELGPATWFVTLSCAEKEWGELRKLLLAVNEDIKGVEKLSMSALCVMDPVTVEEFYKRRMDAFLGEVLLDQKEGPLGHVTDYFWRLEYQQRGAPHVHMKLWVKDAPVLGQEGVTEEQVLEYIQRHVTCAVPSLEENKELYEKVTKFQMHRCTRSCRRFRKSKGKKLATYCRFGFPRAVQERAVLNGLEKSVKESNKGRGVKKLYELKRSETERCVNDYNPVVLMGWNANVDVQFVGEKSMILNKYITGYITKAEKGQTQAIWDAVSSDKSPAARLAKLMFASNKNREVGTYEIADDLLGNPLHGGSVAVQYLGVGMPGQRVRSLKKFKDLEKGEDGNLFMDNLIDVYYPQRNDGLEALSLYDCVAEWRVEKVADPEAEKEKEAAWQRHLSKQTPAARAKAVKAKAKAEKSEGLLSRDGKSRLKKRGKRVLVSTRFVPATKVRAEEFFQQLLMLHVPFRDEMELKRGKETWRAAYEEWEPLVAVLKERRAHKERMQKAEELLRKLEDEAQKEVEAEEANEEAPEWPCQEPKGQGEMDALEGAGISDYMTPEGLAKRVGTLNKKQREVYDKILGVVEHQLGHEETGTECEEPEQVLEFVSGGAGTGKSRLIEVLREGVRLATGRSVLVAAPTGLAAQNVSGVTMHKAFKLPVQKDGKFAYKELTHEEDKEMAESMFKSKLLILDEVSMCSNVTLMFVHQRLMGMLGKKDGSRFAGLNVLVLGDLLQLPPVDRTSMGSCFEPIEKKQWRKAFPNFAMNPFPDGLWREFGYTELTENMRQKGDAVYADLLNDVRVGKVGEAAEVLQQRVWKSPTGLKGIESDVELLRKLKAEGKNPVCLVPKRERATQLNTAMLVEDKVKVKFLHAADTRSLRESKGRKTGGKAKDADMSKGYDGLVKYMAKHGKEDKRKTGNLAQVLAVGVGARVMLTKNVSVEEGLFNGAMGVVEGFVESRKAKDHVLGVAVKFDGSGETVVVERSTASWEPTKSLFVSREQFPLELAYAITVHKSQGLSLDCVVADLGPDVFETGQAYVALSRARSLAGLYLLAFEPRGVRYDEKAVKEYNRLRAKYTDLGPLEAAEMAEPLRRKVMRKSVDDLMDVSPTMRQKVQGKKRRLELEVSLTEEQMAKELEEEADKESAVSMSQLEEQLRGAKRACEAQAQEEDGEDDGIQIEAIPVAEEAELEVLMEEDAEEKQVAFVPLRNRHPERDGVENICFANSAVQMLLSCAPVREWMLSEEEAGLMPGGRAVKEELKELLVAACSEDRRPRNVRRIRDAVAEFSVGLGNQNFSDYGQHCGVEFLERMLEMCGEDLRRLLRYRRREVAKCTGCGAPEVELCRTEDLAWKLYLDDGSGRGGTVSLKSLEDKDLKDRAQRRCPQCCDQRAKVMKRGKLVDNDGVWHDVRRTVEVLGEQKLMLLMINPFFFSERSGQEERSRKKLVGVDPNSVELAGRMWRVVSGMEFEGQRTGGAGHYVAHARVGAHWRRMSDESVSEEAELPVDRLYAMLLQLVE